MVGHGTVLLYGGINDNGFLVSLATAPPVVKPDDFLRPDATIPARAANKALFTSEDDSLASAFCTMPPYFADDIG